MVATVDEHRIELIVDGDIFWSKVHTYTSENRYVNRYVPGQRTYKLATGDSNPYLVYNPWVNPLRPLIQDDVFGQLGCEVHEIGRSKKP